MMISSKAGKRLEATTVTMTIRTASSRSASVIGTGVSSPAITFVECQSDTSSRKAKAGRTSDQMIQRPTIDSSGSMVFSSLRLSSFSANRSISGSSYWYSDSSPSPSPVSEDRCASSAAWRRSMAASKASLRRVICNQRTASWWMTIKPRVSHSVSIRLPVNIPAVYR